MTIRIDCVLDARALLGEAAFWDARLQRLWWVDIDGCAVHLFDPASGHDQIWRLPFRVGCLAPCARDQRLLLATERGFQFFDPASGALTTIADPEADRPEQRFNDGTTDPCGRFWAGTMSLRPERPPTGAFYRLDPDLTWTRSVDGIRTTNGLAFAPDGRTMYLADSAPAVRTIWACDYDPDTGTPSNRRVFVDTTGMPGRPDGGTIDADGCYWMAGVGGWQVVRFTPAGRVDRVVEVPVEKPTKIAFGGRDLDVLYLTSIGQGLTPGSEARQPRAGGLFAFTVPGVRGLELARFAR